MNNNFTMTTLVAVMITVFIGVLMCQLQDC